MIKLKATWVHCDVDIMKHLDDWRLREFYCCCFLQTVYRHKHWWNSDRGFVILTNFCLKSYLDAYVRIPNSKLPGRAKVNINHHSYRWLSWKLLLSLSHASFIPQNEFARQRDPFNHLKLIKNMQKSFLVTSSISSWQIKINVCVSVCRGKNPGIILAVLFTMCF